MGFTVRSLLSAGAALSALALAGCNKIGLVYEFADKLVLYNVEENFDPDKPQRDRLKEKVVAYFRWHRKEVLPAYADFLGFVADNARDGLRAEEIQAGFARYQDLYRRTLEPVPEKAAAFLLGLDSARIDAWLERQRKKNRKLRKEFSGSPQERLDQRAKKIIDELEDWTGKLGKEQRSRIQALNGTLPWNGGHWLELREQVQEKIADLARRKAPADSMRALLKAYFLREEGIKSPEYRQRTRESERKIAILILQIHNLLTPEQRARFIQQVEKLAQDFRARSQQE